MLPIYRRTRRAGNRVIHGDDKETTADSIRTRNSATAQADRHGACIPRLRGRSNPFISGSSVSHFDRTMFRNQLMEPNISNDLGSSLIPPEDMTFRLLQDTGW